MYDEACLGEVENWEELANYLEEYDKQWCIARETEDAWREAVMANTPHLFSLGHDRGKVGFFFRTQLFLPCILYWQDVYTAHVLSLQDEVLHMGSLNSAVLEGIWADLALEHYFSSHPLLM